MSEDSPANLSTDPELLAGFLDETRDQLALVGDQLVRLEREPGDLAVIEAIFRTAHSLKGNAAFFGFMRAKSLAHRLENVLDALRKHRLSADAAVVDCLLHGLDALSATFERIRGGGPEVADEGFYAALLAEVEVQERRAGTGSQQGPDRERLLRDLAAADVALCGVPAAERAVLQAALQHLRALAPPPARAPAAVPGGAPALAAPMPELLAILTPPLEGTLDGERAARVLALLEELQKAAGDAGARALAGEMLEGYQTFVPAMGFDPLLREYLLERLAKVPLEAGFAALAVAAPQGTAAAPPEAHDAAPARPADHATEAQRKADPAGGKNTMRVSEARIDTFLHYVGELLVVGDMFDNLHQRMVRAATAKAQEVQQLAWDMRRANETFGELSNKLQQSIMGVRKVPIRPLLQKVPRIVRDAAQAKGKEVLVTIAGDDIEIDKSLIDLLDAPLTHMSRNAADHGIEKPEARLAAGKPRQGLITVTVAETGSSIVLSIVDDGAGLDLERIRAKAEALGLIAPGAPLGEQDLIACIFAPGLSTAEQVTDISGRGVGMDVVKRSIEESGGTIQITTTRGAGSRFLITVPKRVTTQILVGCLLRVGGQLFVAPLERVRETFCIGDGDVSTIGQRASCILRHDRVLPLVMLDHALGMAPHAPGGARTVVVFESCHRRIAVEVDQVIGVQKVVIRPIEGLPRTNPLVGGGALMGDGTVALMLNLDALDAVA